MSDEKKPSRSKEATQPSEGRAVVPVVAKVLAEIPGIPLVGPLVGSLFDLLKQRTERLRASIQREQEERLAKFYGDMIDGESPALDEQVAQAMLDDKDFHAIVRACLADIEAEKTEAYASMARSFATHAVEKQRRRHFILALRDLSAEELEILRNACIAKSHSLIPAQGSSMNEGHFLSGGAPGTPRSIAIANLAARGFVHDEKLSEAGSAFAQACWRPEQLTPGAIGYRVWSGHNIAIVSYELGSSAAVALATSLQNDLRVAGAKSNIIAITRSNGQQARLISTMAILLVGTKTEHLDANLPYLVEFSKRVPTLLFCEADQGLSHEELAVFGRVQRGGRSDEEVIADIRSRVVERSAAMAGRGRV